MRPLKLFSEHKVFDRLSDGVKVTKHWVREKLHGLLHFDSPKRRTPRDVQEAKDRLMEGLGNVTFGDMAQITLDAIGDAVLVINPKGKVIYLNRVAQTMTGWSSQKALGRSVEDVFFVVDGVTRKRATNPAERAIDEGRTVELALGSILIHSDGTDIAIEDSAAPIYDHDGVVAGAVIVFHDARQSGTVMKRMSHLAQHDFLTGLPNRVLLVERLSHAIAMAKRHQKKMALLFLDLDYFKQINDAFGHAIGDGFLRSVAERIEDCVRVTDTVSRHGGDEFVVVLTEIKERQDAVQVAKKLLARLELPHSIDGRDIQATFSIGISVYPEDGGDVNALMRNADAAMYNAKAGGRNNYQFCRMAS